MTGTFDLIKTTRSVRKYRAEPLPDEVVREILEAGRLSGSSKNTQPWVFIAVQDRERLKALSEAGDFADHLREAGLAVVIVTREERPGVHEFDLGRASQNMAVAARALGVGLCVVYFHHPGAARDVLNLPEGMVSRWGLSFGYPAEDLDRPPKQGGRLPADEVIRWETW